MSEQEKNKFQTSAEISGRRRVDALHQTPPAPEQHQPQYADENEIISRIMNDGNDVDMLEIPEQMKRSGYAYMWAGSDVKGNTDIVRGRLAQLFRVGWQYVDGQRGKGFYWIEGEECPAHVTYKNMVLLERPVKFEQIARQGEQNKATAQMQNKLQEIGHSTTKLGPMTQNVSRSYERSMEVPND